MYAELYVHLQSPRFVLQLLVHHPCLQSNSIEPVSCESELAILSRECSLHRMQLKCLRSLDSLREVSLDEAAPHQLEKGQPWLCSQGASRGESCAPEGCSSCGLHVQSPWTCWACSCPLQTGHHHQLPLEYLTFTSSLPRHAWLPKPQSNPHYEGKAFL